MLPNSVMYCIVHMYHNVVLDLLIKLFTYSRKCIFLTTNKKLTQNKFSFWITFLNLTLHFHRKIMLYSICICIFSRRRCVFSIHRKVCLPIWLVDLFCMKTVAVSSCFVSTTVEFITLPLQGTPFPPPPPPPVRGGYLKATVALSLRIG